MCQALPGALLSSFGAVTRGATLGPAGLNLFENSAHEVLVWGLATNSLH